MSVSEDSASISTGVLDGLLRTTRGGDVPGGIRRRIVCDTAVTWPSARSRQTDGWKSICTRLTPLSVVERTSLRSSTLFMIATSENEVSFAAMSAAGRPL